MIQYWVDKFSIEKKDTPKVFVAFKVISTVSYVGTLAVCYKFKPFSRFVKSSAGVKFNGFLLNKFPTPYNKFIDMRKNLITKVDNNKYIKKVPEAIGLKTSRFTKAFIENFLFYKLTLPVTLPLYLYLSVTYVRSRKMKKKLADACDAKEIKE